MSKHTVEIQETLVATIEVEAKNQEEALKVARQLYRNEEVILDEDNLLDVDYVYLTEDDSTITDEEYLERLNEAIFQFNKKEYLEDEADRKYYTLLDKVLIASTSEVFDSEDKYEYEINCSIDLKNKLDLYIMSNEYITVTVVQDCSYGMMLENLTASFDNWVTCLNGIDYDYASELIDRHLNNDETLLNELNKLKEQNIIVSFVGKENR